MLGESEREVLTLAVLVGALEGSQIQRQTKSTVFLIYSLSMGKDDKNSVAYGKKKLLSIHFIRSLDSMMDSALRA